LITSQIFDFSLQNPLLKSSLISVSHLTTDPRHQMTLKATDIFPIIP
jgi:hypothetical protein